MKEEIVAFDKKTGVAQIKDGVEVIPHMTILGNQKVKTIIIPEGVKKIEAYAFANLRKLEKVVLPSTLTQIGSMGFCVCGAAKVALPDSLTEIGRAGLDFDNGRVTVNASNYALVEEVGYSMRNQRYKAECKDDVVTFSDLQFIEDPEMTIQKAWSRLEHYNYARQRQEKRQAELKEAGE